MGHIFFYFPELVDAADKSLLISNCEDLLTIEIETGPKQKHRKNVDSLKKLSAAYASKCRILVTLGNVENQQQFGWFFDFMEQVQSVFRMVSNKPLKRKLENL